MNLDDLSLITSEQELRALHHAPMSRSTDKVIAHLDKHCRAILVLSPFCVLATQGPGGADVSPRGDPPGFIRVLDERTIAFPIYDGNGMYMTTGSIADQGEVGLLFIDFEGQSRMRLNGVATLHFDDPLMAEYPEAQFIVRVQAREVFVNCPRYIHKMELVERSRFVPKANVETPIADWKRGMVERGAGDLLRADDPARNLD